MKLRTRTTTVLATLALALAACGGAEETSVEDPSAAAEESAAETADDADDTQGADDAGSESDEPDADDADAEGGADGQDAASGADAATVLAAAGDQARGRSARIAFSMTTVTPEGELVAEGEGVSSADGDAQIMMTITGDTPENDLGELEVRIIDGVIYQRNDQMLAAFGGDATWLAIDPAAIGGEFSGMISQTSTGDPAEILDVLRDVGEVTAAGEEEVNGVATTRYEVTVSQRALLEGADADPDEFRGYGVDLDAPSTMTVWIDGDGLPRRIAYDATFADGVSVSSIHDVLEYDIDVEVQVPPEGETISFADMMGGLGQG